MTSRLTNLKRALPLVCAALLVAGSAQAALQDRDLDGDSVTDAFYDTDLNITWLRNANVNGKMSRDAAVAWAAGFSFAGYDDWRLPKAFDCDGHYCDPTDEIAHLWYIELGNVLGGPMTNTGSFQNLLPSSYWLGGEFSGYPGLVFWFDAGTGSFVSTRDGEFFHWYAMAVRDGDVPSIPEPAAYALMLAGLAGIAVMTRRRPI